MKTVSIEIPEDLVADMRAMLEERLNKSLEEAAKYRTQLSKLNATTAIASVKTQQDSFQPKLPLASSGRQTKEQVKELVLTFLATTSPSSTKINSILKSVGTSYSTTFRVLRDLKAEGKVSSNPDGWRIIK